MQITIQKASAVKTGNVPHYVLNGIANVLKEEYYDSIK